MTNKGAIVDIVLLQFQWNFPDIRLGKPYIRRDIYNIWQERVGSEFERFVGSFVSFRFYSRNKAGFFTALLLSRAFPGKTGYVAQSVLPCSTVPHN